MALWSAIRAFGMVSLVLLSTVMVLGLLTAGRRSSSPYVTTALHRSLSLLTVVFVGLHVVAGVVDSYVPISATAALAPFTSSYRPFWVGLGAVALDLLIALIVTSLLRSRLGLRTWRALHWTAYATWPVAMAHGLGTGTDTKTMLALTTACAAAVLTATATRLSKSPPVRPQAGHLNTAPVASRRPPALTPEVRP